MTSTIISKAGFWRRAHGRLGHALFSSKGSVLESIETHNNNYNLIRFMLAASVILFHSNYIVGVAKPDSISRLLLPATDLGGLAVQCFFFLSGLFVSQSISKDTSLIDFSIKRFMRIFPGLFACTIISVIMLALVSLGVNFWKILFIPETYDYILKTGSLINIQWTVPGILGGNVSQTINGSIHTLPSELKMYVMLGLLGFAGLTQRRNQLGYCAFAILVVMTIVGKPVLALWAAPDDAFAMVFMFVAGMLVYAWAGHLRVNLAQGIVLAVAMVMSHRTALLGAIVLYAFTIWGMLYLGQMPLLHKLLHPRTDPSYGIYIYGWPSEQLVRALYPAVNAREMTLAALLIAFGFAVLSWKFVEKPCMDLAKSVVRHRNLVGIRETVFSSDRSGSLAFGCLVILLAACLGLSWFTNRVSVLPAVPMTAKIVNFGPRESEAGLGFNVQPNGVSGLWLTLSGPPPSDVSVVFDGHRLATTSSPHSNTVTAAVPAALLNAGNKQIFLRGFADGEVRQSNAVVLPIR